MENKTILVTGIGGNVGQGILRNLVSSPYKLKLIGCNTSKYSAGNHLVDEFYQVPSGNSFDYLEVINYIVEKNKIDLIIPSTDIETAVLANAKDQFNCKIASSGPKSSNLYLDKYLSYIHHEKFGIPFAKSILPSNFHTISFKNIAKPRQGRGSRGIYLNVTDAKELKNDEYVIQEFLEGKEITTAAYISYLSGEFVGSITMERTLENGATTYCKVIKDFDDQIQLILTNMAKYSDLTGAFNVQSIVCNNKIIPFEVNCRISGTNSIRSHFGFQDVLYTIEELLFEKKISKPDIKTGTAFRFLADVIYPNGPAYNNSSDSFTIF